MYTFLFRRKSEVCLIRSTPHAIPNTNLSDQHLPERQRVLGSEAFLAPDAAGPPKGAPRPLSAPPKDDSLSTAHPGSRFDVVRHRTGPDLIWNLASGSPRLKAAGWSLSKSSEALNLNPYHAGSIMPDRTLSALRHPFGQHPFWKTLEAYSVERLEQFFNCGETYVLNSPPQHPGLPVIEHAPIATS